MSATKYGLRCDGCGRLSRHPLDCPAHPLRAELDAARAEVERLREALVARGEGQADG